MPEQQSLHGHAVVDHPRDLQRVCVEQLTWALRVVAQDDPPIPTSRVTGGDLTHWPRRLLHAPCRSRSHPFRPGRGKTAGPSQLRPTRRPATRRRERNPVPVRHQRLQRAVNRGIRALTKNTPWRPSRDRVRFRSGHAHQRRPTPANFRPAPPKLAIPTPATSADHRHPGLSRRRSRVRVPSLPLQHRLEPWKILST